MSGDEELAQFFSDLECLPCTILIMVIKDRMSRLVDVSRGFPGLQGSFRSEAMSFVFHAEPSRCSDWATTVSASNSN